MIVDVILPARDEGDSIGDVVAAVPARVVRSVVVVDNGSLDDTARRAEDAGAIVVRETRPGYGAACLRGLAHLAALPKPPDAVVFLSASGTDDPAQIPMLLQPLRESLFDLVIGSRTLGGHGHGTPGHGAGKLAPRQVAGNLVATSLIKAIYGHRYTDLSPFRAIRYPALVALGMRDAGFGFLVEMQVKALKVGLRIAETPVTFRRVRARGLSDEVRRAVGTSAKVLFQIFRHSTAR